jgi:magnesium chelatase subunit D
MNSVTPWIPDDPLTRGLCYAALEPGLRSVLIYDLDPAALDIVARRFAGLLNVADELVVEVAVLPAWAGDDELWGSWTWAEGELGRVQVVASPGFFGPRVGDPVLRLLVVPDLSRLGVAAARGIMSLAGAELADLQRHGRGLSWVPRLVWVAACPAGAIRRVSRHLLDRFALRLSAAERSPDTVLEARLADVCACLGCPGGAGKGDVGPAPTSEPGLCAALRRGMTCRPEVMPQALRRVVAYDNRASGQGHRLSLTLMRLAVAEARLSGNGFVEPRHVDAAARLLDLPEIRGDLDQVASTTDDVAAPLPPIDAPVPSLHGSVGPGPVLNTGSDEAPVPVSASPGAENFVGAEINMGPAPSRRGPAYAEDLVPVDRKVASLQCRATTRLVGEGRGPVVGVRRAHKLVNIAYASTLLEAAKYQAVRHRPEGVRGLVISPSDLRQFVRAPTIKPLLVLLIDFTGLRDREESAARALQPHLEWAYVERAEVAVVRVGDAGRQPPDDLRAELVAVPSLLSPRLVPALAGAPGRATPLAHGFDLVLETLHRDRRQAPRGGREARLIVLTDGRANVPLESSRDGRPPTRPVGRAGIDDSLAVARRIRAFRGTQAVVLDPCPRDYPQLPAELAEALGAVTIPLDSADAEAST